MSARRAPRCRLAASVLCTGLFAVLIGACRDLVAGDDAVDYGEALCAELLRCTGEDACTVSSALRQSEFQPSVVQRYLEFAADADCLSSCRNAKRCLDFPPVCAGPGRSCALDADCCGASERLGRCDAGTKECCGELGAKCDDAADCCSGEECLAVGGGTEKRCGGFECSTLGDSCGSNFECCSRRCEGGVCASSTCGSVGESCSTADDCCIQNTPIGEQLLECRAGSCQPPVDECVGCDPLDVSNCCTINQAVCYQAIDGSSFCGQQSCSPQGVACASDADCCGGEGLVCSRAGVPHCAKACTSAGELGCCRPAQFECSVGAQCCSGACIAGTCLGADPGCLPPSCHAPTAIGGPLGPSNASCPEYEQNAACINAVCADEPNCCCVAWTLSCAQAFQLKTAGGNTCP
jgi:hypothetical protein